MSFYTKSQSTLKMRVDATYQLQIEYFLHQCSEDVMEVSLVAIAMPVLFAQRLHL